MKNKAKYLELTSSKTWPEKLKTNDFQLFLDYDGTLAPFKDDPDKAYPIEGTNQIINKFLEKNIPVTIVTGRNALDIREKFIKPIIPVIGLHGREFLPTKQKKPFKIGPVINGIPDELLNKIKSIIDSNPVKLEEKDNSYAIHIKNNENLQEYIYRSLNKILRNLKLNDDWEVISGREVLELRPANWNKANAIKKYREPNILAIYIGDDRTDEDVFNNLNEPGLSIYVKNEDQDTETAADYYLKNPTEVINFLNTLLI